MDYILGRENWEFCVQVATLVLSWDAHRLLATSTDPWSIVQVNSSRPAMDLGSDSSVSKKDAKLGFVVNLH